MKKNLAVLAIAMLLAARVHGQATNSDAKPPEAATPATAAATNAPAALADGELRLNFKNAPLDLVLNYMSEAAGFVIVLETEVKGKVDVWSNRPVSRDEAVNVLNSVLNKNGYAAIRHENTLTIVKRDEAKIRDIPVKSGSDPKGIPRNDEMVTQILPVRHVNATQLVKDLQPLLPTDATLTANEGGNALVLTDTQANIRRMAEIISALDTAIANNSTIKVFPLKYADAKELATAVKELFAPAQTQQNQAGRAQQFQNRFGAGGFGNIPGFGGGGPGGGGAGGAPGGRGGGGTGGGAAAGNPNAARVLAVADERTNALVVSAPDELMSDIQNLVKEIDVSASDITELRVFHLQNADPVEMADMFAQLFPDDAKAGDTQNQGFQFRGGGFFGGGAGNRGGRGNTAADASSDRMKKKGRVSAVPDPRTASIIVSAASELMPQIAEMVAQLDSNPARKQKVFVYSLENADVQEVEGILRDMFDRNGTSSASRTGANQNSALQNRQQQNMNNTSGSTSSGFGNNTGGGGGATQAFR